MIVAILSDIHSNLAALEAVLRSLGTVDAVWQLGDLVGYGPEPDGVVERMREIRAVGVMGNHDDAVCGGAGIEYFNPDAQAAVRWTQAHTAPSTRAYLALLPLRIEPEGTDFTLVHGSPREPLSEYLEMGDDAAECLADVATRHYLIGHTHLPLAFRERRRGGMAVAMMKSGGLVRLDGRRMALNPGSVGQPRDGNPRASYMILDTGAGLATWRRVLYDIEGTQAAMRAAGLPPFLARRLSLGR
jgi:predicted phosphodiesterase